MPDGRIRLTVVPLGSVGNAELERLGASVGARLPLEVFVADPLPSPASYGPRPGSGELLDRLAERKDSAAGGWVLGVVEAELSAPERDFVFGEAEVTGRCAVIGIAPLALGVGPEVVSRRVLAEAVHELGHLAGLPHCPDEECAMYPSVTVEDTDRKGADYCESCAASLANLLGCSLP